jgi:Holliday junction resolvase RusA-like endonuclease
MTVLGTPAAKGNPRAFVNKRTGKAILASFGSGTTEKRLRSWDVNVRDQARLAVGDARTPPFVDTALAVVLVFRVKRPAGHWGKGKRAGQLVPSAPQHPRSKPDLDKLARATLDALTGIVFDDDARITMLVARKEYARPGCEGATISVTEARPTTPVVAQPATQQVLDISGASLGIDVAQAIGTIGLGCPEMTSVSA